MLERERFSKKFTEKIEGALQVGGRGHAFIMLLG